MTWNDAAEKFLRAEKKPLHYKLLSDKILQQKLVQTEGKTPHLTLHASISLENKARQEKGIPPRFTIERGEVRLAAWERPAAAIFHQAGVERDRVKTELLKRLRQLSGEEFEGYIEALLVKMGYQNVEIRGGPGDEGIDLLCEMSQGINRSRRQCRPSANSDRIKWDRTPLPVRLNRSAAKDVSYLRLSAEFALTL